MVPFYIGLKLSFFFKIKFKENSIYLYPYSSLHLFVFRSDVMQSMALE